MFGFDVAAIVLASVFFRKLKNAVKPIIIILEIFVAGLSIGSFVIWILTASGVAPYVLAWVGLGLTCGCILFSVVTIILALTCRKSRQLSFDYYNSKQYQQQYGYQQEQYSYQQQYPQQPQPQPVPQPVLQPAPQPSESNYDYIDEIKRLKELLDMNAITVEEFENKKKQLLGL